MFRWLRSLFSKCPDHLPLYIDDGGFTGQFRSHMEEWHPEIHISRTTWSRQMNDWEKGNPYMWHDELHYGGTAGNPRHFHNDFLDEP